MCWRAPTFLGGRHCWWVVRGEGGREGGREGEGETSECGRGACLAHLPFFGTHLLPSLSLPLQKKKTMGRLKSSLDTVAQMHRLVRLGGMPAPRWLDAAEK